MENTILLMLFLFALLGLLGLAEAVVSLRSWYKRKSANSTYWSAYARN
jgi:hypothetical protein